MELKITLVFCLCTDILTEMRHQENSQCQLNDAEIMTIAITATASSRFKFRMKDN